MCIWEQSTNKTVYFITIFMVLFFDELSPMVKHTIIHYKNNIYTKCDIYYTYTYIFDIAIAFIKLNMTGYSIDFNLIQFNILYKI